MGEGTYFGLQELEILVGESVHRKNMFGRKKKIFLKEWGCKEWCKELEGTIYKGKAFNEKKREKSF